MNIAILSFLVIVLLSLVGVVGDFFIKMASKNTPLIYNWWFVIGAVIYALTAFGWVFAMKYAKLSILGVIYAISTVLFLIVVGVFYFKESLDAYEIIGIFLAIVSLILLTRFA
jgi:drug/metabolite transporter (DMT)-like permease